MSLFQECDFIRLIAASSLFEVHCGVYTLCALWRERARGALELITVHAWEGDMAISFITVTSKGGLISTDLLSSG